MRLLLPNPGAGGPWRIRPEWKGMEALATNQYAQAMQALASATNEYVRFLSLDRAAKMSLAVGRTEDARQFATDMMLLDDEYSRGEGVRPEVGPRKSSGTSSNEAYGPTPSEAGLMWNRTSSTPPCRGLWPTPKGPAVPRGRLHLSLWATPVICQGCDTTALRPFWPLPRVGPSRRCPMWSDPGLDYTIPSGLAAV